MPKYKETYISIEDFEVLQGLERPYEGFVVGLGYAYLLSFFTPPPNFNGYSHAEVPPQANRFTLIRGQYVDNSPEMITQSLIGFIEPSEVHTVQHGDTLSALALRYRVSVDDLTQWNGLRNPDKINVGQKLVISQPSIAITQLAEHVREHYRRKTRRTNSMGPISKSVEFPTITIAAPVAGAGETLYYSEKYGTWMGKNFKIYSQTWGGNGAVGGKLKFGKRTHGYFKKAGRALFAYNAYEYLKQYSDDEINTSQFLMEEASNIFSTFGGLPGLGWGIGWELGRQITYTGAYQEFKYNMWYKCTERVYGPPCERNEHLWYEAYKKYKP